MADFANIGQKNTENRELELRSLTADMTAAYVFWFSPLSFGIKHRDGSAVSKHEELDWGDDIRALPYVVPAIQKLVDRNTKHKGH
jgi:hypothetical protein